MYRNQILKSKGFDGILEYAIKTNTFRQKVILFYSKYLKRTSFDQLKCAEIQTHNERMELFVSKMSGFHAKIVNLIQDQVRETFFGILYYKPTAAHSQISSSNHFFKETRMDQSRRSSTSYLSRESKMSRRYAAITEQITLPSMKKSHFPPKVA